MWHIPGEKINADEGLMGKAVVMRPSEKPRHRWENYVKIYLKQFG
jgi:hypothetical protein